MPVEASETYTAKGVALRTATSTGVTNVPGTNGVVGGAAYEPTREPLGSNL
jgi:hypothetical protein